MRYIVTDSEDNIMRAFSNFKDASNYKYSFGNQYWRIKVSW